MDQGNAKHITILTFYGIPDIEHPWVNTDQDKCIKYMNKLKENNFELIALRDYPVKH